MKTSNSKAMTHTLTSKGKWQYKIIKKENFMILRRRFNDKDVWLLRAALLNDERVNAWSIKDAQQPEWLKNWKGTCKWGVLLRAALHSTCHGLPHRIVSLTMFERTIEVNSPKDQESSIDFPAKETFRDWREALKNFTHRVGRAVQKDGFTTYYPYVYEPYSKLDVEMAYHYLQPRVKSGLRTMEHLGDENTIVTLKAPLKTVLLKAETAYNCHGRRHETTFRMHPYHCSVHDRIDHDLTGQDQEETRHYQDWRKALKEFLVLTTRR